MAVLRCPYCGERVRPGDNFCSHCGKKFDKPHVDDVDTMFQESASIMASLIKFILLWVVVGLIVGFITHGLNLLPMYSPWLLIWTTILTVIVWLLIKLKK